MTHTRTRTATRSQELGSYDNGVVESAYEKNGSDSALMHANYIITEWETGYILRDLDSGQVIVS